MEKYCLFGGLVIAMIGALKDLRGRTIPNWLTYSGILSGFLFRFAMGSWPAFKDGLFGLLIGGGFLYLLFLAGGMGGGDVKLMGAVAAWVGPAQTIRILTIAAIAGGVLAIVYVFKQRRMRIVLRNSFELLRHHLVAGLKPHPLLNINEPGCVRIPYGIAIGIGTVFCASSIFWRR